MAKFTTEELLMLTDYVCGQRVQGNPSGNRIGGLATRKGVKNGTLIYAFSRNAERLERFFASFEKARMAVCESLGTLNKETNQFEFGDNKAAFEAAYQELVKQEEEFCPYVIEIPVLVPHLPEYDLAYDGIKALKYFGVVHDPDDDGPPESEEPANEKPPHQNETAADEAQPGEEKPKKK